jgi:hypothetical protein
LYFFDQSFDSEFDKKSPGVSWGVQYRPFLVIPLNK